MSLTISTKTYTFDSNPTPDSAQYYGPSQTNAVKDLVIFKRMKPRPSNGFAGVARQSEKTVKSVLIDGVYRDLIAETQFSYPVQAHASDVTSLRADHQSLLANAATQTLVDNGKLTY